MTRGPAPTTVGRIREALTQNPRLSHSELVEILGVSKQRISQVAKQYGLSLNRPQKPIAPKFRSVLRPALGCEGNISSSTAGTIGELIAAADLMARGWQVFFPFVRSTKCDLIATTRDGGKVIRVEVRCARRSGARLVFWKKEQAACDYFAIVVIGETVIYQPELPALLPPDYCKFAEPEGAPHAG